MCFGVVHYSFPPKVASLDKILDAAIMLTNVIPSDLRTYANLGNFCSLNPLNPPYQGDFKAKCVSLVISKI